MGAIEISIKSEISRLARREARRLVTPIRDDLRRQRARVRALEGRLTRLEKSVRLERAARRLENSAAPETVEKKRLSPYLIKKLRARLGITQLELARLVGVSGQSVVVWESGKVRPRPAIRAKILSLRGMGRRNVRIALEAARKPIGRKPRAARKLRIRRRRRRK